MSESSDKPKPKKGGLGDGPRFRRPEQRTRVALAKYYGMDGEEWSISEIADYLNVTESTVEDYIYNSEMAEEVRGALAQKEAQTRMDLFLQLKDRFERLKDIEEELMEAKDVVVTGHQLQTVRGEVSFSNVDGVKPPGGDEAIGNEVQLDVPVASDFDEVTDVSALQQVWEEMREVQEQMEDLLGLEAPDQQEVHKTEKKKTEKVYRFEGVDDALPDQEQDVIEVSSTEVAEESDKNYPDLNEDGDE